MGRSFMILIFALAAIVVLMVFFSREKVEVNPEQLDEEVILTKEFLI